MTFMQSSTHLHEDFFLNFWWPECEMMMTRDVLRVIGGEAHRVQVKQTLCADFMLNLPSVMSRVCHMSAH